MLVRDRFIELRRLSTPLSIGLCQKWLSVHLKIAKFFTWFQTLRKCTLTMKSKTRMWSYKFYEMYKLFMIFNLSLTEHSWTYHNFHSFAFKLQPPSTSSPVNVLHIFWENGSVEFHFPKSFLKSDGSVPQSFFLGFFKILKAVLFQKSKSI